MKRLLVILAIGVLLPTIGKADNCTFPSQLDNIAPLNPGDLVKPAWNVAVCAVNKLEQRALYTPRAETVCAPVTIAAGTRTSVALTASAPFVGTELVIPQAQDPSGPPGLEANSYVTPGGAAVNVSVWNKDAINSHTGHACALVVRP